MARKFLHFSKVMQVESFVIKLLLGMGNMLCMLIVHSCGLGLSGNLWMPVIVGEGWLGTRVVWGKMEQ